MAGWSDDELRATIRVYLTMAQLQIEGKRFSKTELRKELMNGPVNARTKQSIEFRMRNISAVMEEHGQPIVSGYLPAKHVGTSVRARLWSLIEQERPQPESAASTSGTELQGQNRPPVIYFNIGWMKKYDGMTADDPTLGRHGYLAAHGHGHESFNFSRTPDGRVEGYRPGRGGVNIQRLGAGRGAKSINGVLVVWLATEPISGRALIVGWYEKATVYATPREGGHHVADGPWQFTVEAKAVEAHLVPVVARTFWVQSARTATDGGFGQNPTWYGNDAVNQRVWDYVRLVHKRIAAKPAPKQPPVNLDPDLRRKVEKAAVDRATAYYKSREGGSCSVESVEPYGRGWDLEVRGEGIDWLVEVKGLQGPNLACELTPNEYEKMRMVGIQERYVVFVVNNALESPVSSIFHYSAGAWLTADGRKLDVEERVAAILRSGSA